jgi:fumarate reductase subunit D
MANLFLSAPPVTEKLTPKFVLVVSLINVFSLFSGTETSAVVIRNFSTVTAMVFLVVSVLPKDAFF